MGQPHSERMRIVIWEMISSRLTTAQKIPPVWFGTVLFLDSVVRNEKRNDKDDTYSM